MIVTPAGRWIEKYPPDEGCSVWSACLRCPLPRCIYESRGETLRGAHAIRRWLDAAALAAEGQTVSEIAAALGMDKRTVYRALTGARRLGVAMHRTADAGERAEATR